MENNSTVIIEGEENVRRAQLLILRKALKLELIGLKSRGGSVYAKVKRAYNLKGSKQSVYEQFTRICSEATGLELKP